MKVPPEAIAEFKLLYQEKFQLELSNAEAEEMADELLTLYALSQGKPNIL